MTKTVKLHGIYRYKKGTPTKNLMENKTMINAIKANLIKLEELEKVANHAEADYEREPENAEYEETFDRAYSAEFAAFIAVSKQIAEFTGMDEKVARTLVRTRRNDILNILERSI